MASLKSLCSYYLDDAINAVGWMVVWKKKRSWNIDMVYPEFNEKTSRFCFDSDDMETINDIVRIDRNAIIVNAYYVNIGGMEELTVSDLDCGLRWHYYDLKDCQLIDVINNCLQN